MDFYEVVGRVLELLQRQRRVSYRALKRQFGVDDEYIEDLKEELLYAHESAVQADERGFTWTGETEAIPAATSHLDQPEPQAVAAQTHTTPADSPPVATRTPDQVAMLVERVTDGKHLPEEVMHHLIEKTDGVPLYVEEMTKALIESGHLKANDAGYELTQPLATVSIPATLHDSLMARLDHLDTAKGVAQLGTTIGRQFSYDLLQAVSPLSATSLQRELEKLVDAELIYQRGVAPNPTYIFKHALVQDSAYQSLLRSTRQGYHRRIAEVLEEAALSLLTQQGFTLWMQISTILKGWALTARGQEEGLALMHQGMKDFRSSGGVLFIPYFLSLLAEGYGAFTQVEAGLDALQEGVEEMARTGEHWWKAEVHRLQGHLLLQQSSDHATEAASCVHQAISIAQSQSAKSLELRATTSLARLWQSQDKCQEAYDLLAPVYNWFTEGFDTADLQDAKALLDELVEVAS